MTVEPFKISIAADVIDDAKRRVDTTRWPDDLDNDDWYYGTKSSSG